MFNFGFIYSTYKIFLILFSFAFLNTFEIYFWTLFWTWTFSEQKILSVCCNQALLLHALPFVVIYADVMASKGLVKYFGLKNWNYVNVSSTGKFSVCFRNKCSDCGQLLFSSTVVLDSFKVNNLHDKRKSSFSLFTLFNQTSLPLRSFIFRFLSTLPLPMTILKVWVLFQNHKV